MRTRRRAPTDWKGIFLLQLHSTETTEAVLILSCTFQALPNADKCVKYLRTAASGGGSISPAAVRSDSGTSAAIPADVPPTLVRPTGGHADADLRQSPPYVQR